MDLGEEFKTWQNKLQIAQNNDKTHSDHKNNQTRRGKHQQGRSRNKKQSHKINQGPILSERTINPASQQSG